MDKQPRRRLLALLSLACLLIATYLCASLVIRTRQHDPSVTNAGDDSDGGGGGVAPLQHQQLQRRQTLLTAVAESPSMNKRVRTHKVSTSATISNTNTNTVQGNNNGRESGGGPGTLTKDSQGLPVEIASESPAVTATTKIINGIPQSRSSHPYIVRLHWTYPGINADQSKYVSFCGGSLITPNIILTAAHCLGQYEKYVDIYDVVTGSPKTYKIEQSILHPKYDEDEFGYDFGLLLIESTHLEVVVMKDPAINDGEEYWSIVGDEVFDWEEAPPMVRLHRYNNITHGTSTSTTKSATSRSGHQCTSLSEKQSKDLTTMTVIGYGSTSYNFNDGAGNPSYSSLQGADVQYILNDECNDMYLKARDWNTGTVITDDQLCANDIDENQDACSGDSGGPLVAQFDNVASSSSSSLWTQVGIVSWGIGCALEKYPGVYSRVAHEIEWIEGEICGVSGREGKRNGGGLSPLSCVVDGNSGERRLRDYAIEADVARNQNGGFDSSARREEEEVIEEHAMRREKVELSFPQSKKKIQSQKQQQFRREPCELLEGPSFTYEEVAPLLTPRPTNSPTTNPPTRNPTDITTFATTTAPTTCPSTNQLDVNSFLVGNNSNRRRTCKWVRRKCRRRCVEYSNCCPQSCSLRKCNSN